MVLVLVLVMGMGNWVGFTTPERIPSGEQSFFVSVCDRWFNHVCVEYSTTFSHVMSCLNGKGER